jgi:hypothetical protein
LLITAAKLFSKNPKRGRLLIDDTVITGPKLFMTLGDYGMPLGTLVYVEFTNEQNEWPSELGKRN